MHTWNFVQHIFKCQRESFIPHSHFSLCCVCLFFLNWVLYGIFLGYMQWLFSLKPFKHSLIHIHISTKQQLKRLHKHNKWIKLSFEKFSFTLTFRFCDVLSVRVYHLRERERETVQKVKLVLCVNSAVVVVVRVLYCICCRVFEVVWLRSVTMCARCNKMRIYAFNCENMLDFSGTNWMIKCHIEIQVKKGFILNEIATLYTQHTLSSTIPT